MEPGEPGEPGGPAGGDRPGGPGVPGLSGGETWPAGVFSPPGTTWEWRATCWPARAGTAGRSQPTLWAGWEAAGGAGGGCDVGVGGAGDAVGAGGVGQPQSLVSVVDTPAWTPSSPSQTLTVGRSLGIL